ncbi:hypothetical protein JX265_006361 [Neoarthrinium moseri]|uniref:LysM domain-containing protein n=1 Tax=Neoarthrinium moseri TaxID=1658444 RepID=A0A9P9WMC4_9PEZI|nr:uncharacterized protein JN550_008250 [Neoarthrinium moseri]KAI1852311.1 hypothetical protein JX266_002489 [Neoarthrinium moseri]KAI1865493.1 hypothetical protein JN550_008250 [Neoarthrinium moseri]KAI1870191.1 hypothetical protein JX265_006361 [Neoarthrinium moseri]
MGRWSHYDTDDERLPEGMVRIGYDADDQTYTFRDADGSIWESAPGNRYGSLRCVSRPTQRRDSFADNDDPESPPPPYSMPEASYPTPEVSWRAEMMPLFNFFMIIALFLIGVFFYLRATAGSIDQQIPVAQCDSGTMPYHIKGGDTCWAIAENRGMSVDALKRDNGGLDCDNLRVGQTICIPEA